MNTIKKLIFDKASPINRLEVNQELRLTVYFLAITIAFVLTASIIGI